MIEKLVQLGVIAFVFAGCFFTYMALAFVIAALQLALN